MDVVASVGLDPGPTAELLGIVGENLGDLVLVEARSVGSSDINGTTRWAPEMGSEHSIGSALLAPLLQDGCTIGVLAVATRERRTFSDADGSLLLLLAKQAVTAIAADHGREKQRARSEKLQLVVRELNDRSSAMNRAREARECLVDVALAGGGLPGLAAALAELVDQPVAIASVSGVILCTGHSRESDVGAFDQAGIAKDVRRACERRSKLESISPVHAYDVSVDGQVSGFLVVLERSSLNDALETVLKEASVIVAGEMFRERSLSDAEARFHGGALEGLIFSSEQSDPGWSRGQAALLGLGVDQTHCMIAARPAVGIPAPERTVVVEAGLRAASRVGLQGLFGTADETTVALLASGDRSLGRESAEEWIEDFAGELQKRGAEGEMSFGISRIDKGQGNPRSGYMTASQALAVGQLSSGKLVTHFEDVELFATLVDVTKHEQLKRYVECAIGRLLDYDEEKDSNLAGTLEVYLDCSGVAVHAARKLFLHPHSLRYRLRRIVEIQQIDLDDSMSRLTAHLALKLRPLLG